MTDFSSSSSNTPGQNAPAKKADKPSKKAKSSAARLFAVQGVYQMLANQQAPAPVLEDILHKRIYEPVNGEMLVTPDGVLLSKIIKGVHERRDDLGQIVLANYHKNKGPKNAAPSGDKSGPEAPESLVFALLLCGVYEIMAHHEIDAPIIISDYINVGHAFFDRGETKLINALLDTAAKTLR